MSKQTTIQITRTISANVLKPFPPNENPFNHDLFNMGTKMGKDLMIMHANHDTEDCKYIVLINTKTGERVKIEFDTTQESSYCMCDRLYVCPKHRD